MKIHILLEDVPFSGGVSRLSLCGEPVPNATAVYFWDELSIGVSLFPSSREACTKCRAKFTESMSDKCFYVYGIVNGDKLRRRQQKRTLKGESQ